MKFKIFTPVLVIIVVILMLSCTGKEKKVVGINKPAHNIINDGPASIIPRNNDTTTYTRYDCCFVVSTMIKYPPEGKKIKGTILMLHGWNLPFEEWCLKTTFCNKALNKGYVLIIPNYSKSNYTLEIYPQTIAEYRKYPTLSWIIDFHIPWLQQEHGLLMKEHKNFVAGISTGARGATLLAYRLPEIFKGVASLSGDFDITKMTDEYLYYSFLGHYKDFPERWRKESFAFDCKNYKVPSYIGHGKADKMSPVKQSLLMYDSLSINNPGMKLIGNFPENAGHDYIYWESETDNILDFFETLVLF